MFPAYVLCLNSIQDIEKAFISLGRFMTKLIKSKRESVRSGDEKNATSHDVFSIMMKASEGEGKLAMADDELVGLAYGSQVLNRLTSL